MDRYSSEETQEPFDIEAPLFTAAECAEVSGLSRALVDVWVGRNLLPPTRREYSPRRSKGRVRKGRGRPMFSAVAIFKVRVASELGRYFKIGLSEWSPVGTEVERAQNESELSAAAAIAGISAEGNWMWAVARALEADKRFNVYGYAAYQNREWLFDMHIGDQLIEPCFGTTIPHIFIPMSDIFESVYKDCKKLLGLVASRDNGP